MRKLVLALAVVVGSAAPTLAVEARNFTPIAKPANASVIVAQRMCTTTCHGNICTTFCF